MPFRSNKLPDGGQVNVSDLKSFEAYAQDISNELEQNFGKDRDGYIFAISAKWGAGKSYLLKLIEPLLKAKKFEVVTFNAWQYTDDAETLRRAFLKSIQKQLRRNWRGLFISKRRALRKLDYEETRTSILIPPIIIFILIGLVVLLSLAINWHIYLHLYHGILQFIHFIQSNSAASYLITLILAILALPSLLHVQRKSNKVTSVDDFEDLFRKIIRGHSKLIIFIDDLDRCTPEGAKLVLDTLKTFFLKQNVAYVVTGDHSVLERYMGDQLGVEPIYDSEGNIDQRVTEIEKRLEGRRYMQKIFNVYWKLPVLEPSENELLIDKELSKIKGLTATDQAVTKLLLVAYLEKTPREIKRFASLLEFSLKSINTRIKNLASEKDDASHQITLNLEQVTERPALLAKVLLMQEKFDVAYYYFSRDPKKYREFEKAALRHTSDAEISTMVKEIQEAMGVLSYNQFVNFILTAPTFHTPNGLSLIVSPELFFYYSGFAGATQTGLLSEDFLTRYVTADDKLIDDFRNTSPDNIRENMLLSGIDNLDKIEADNLSQAIANMLELFMIEGLDHDKLFPSFIQAKNLQTNWATLTEERREAMIKDVASLVIRYKDATALDVLFEDQPWKTKIAALIGHFNFAILDQALLDLFVLKFTAEPPLAERDQFRKQLFEQCLYVITSPENYSVEAIQVALDRLSISKLNLYELADEATFTSIVAALLNLPEQSEPKAKILLGLLRKDNKLWSILPRPKTITSFKKKGKLHKRYGEDVTKVFDSWKIEKAF